MQEEKKVKNVQKYSFEVIHYEDGSSVINRTNDGFSVIEMIGISEIIKEKCMGVFKTAIKKPDEQNLKSTNSPLIHKPE